jgi:acetyltransferase-like isoleucine patch superfamily enzyme
MTIRMLMKKIGYSKLIPKGFLRFCDDLLLIPAMWFPGSFMREFFNRARGVRIGIKVFIGQGAMLGQHPFLLTIKNNVIISAGVKILTHDTSFTVVGSKDLAGEVVIGNNVQIGENVIILPGVRIGDNCVIGANAVVNKDIPSGSVAAGVPVKVICPIEEGIRRLDTKLKSDRYFSTW